MTAPTEECQTSTTCNECEKWTWGVVPAEHDCADHGVTVCHVSHSPDAECVDN